jgi:hypothetical protein
MPTNINALLALVTNGRYDVTHGCLMSLLNFQNELARREHCKVHILAIRTINDALCLALSEKYDVVAVLDGMHVAPPGFFATHVCSDKHPVVVGCSPLPGVIDWDRLRSRLHDTPSNATQEDGYVYNVPLSSGSMGPENGLLRLKASECMPSRWSVMVVRLHALEKVSESLGTKTLLWSHETDADDVLCTPEHRFAMAWGGDVMVDVGRPCSSFGEVGYHGCLGDIVKLQNNKKTSVKSD